MPQPQLQSNTEPDLAHYSKVLRRRRWMIVSLVLIALATATVLSVLDTAQYRAVTKVLVRNPTSTLSGSSTDVMTPRSLANALERANSERVVSVARRQVGPEPQMVAGSTKDSDVFSFMAQSANASLAATASQLHAQAFVDDELARVLAQDQAMADLLQRRIDEAKNSVSLLEVQQQKAIDAIPVGAPDRQQQIADIQNQSRNQIQEAELQVQTLTEQFDNQKAVSELARSSGSQIVDAAVEPSSPTTPNIRRNLLLALVVSLIVGVGLALVLDHLDTKLRNEEQLADITGLAMLAGIPVLKDWSSKGTARVITREDPQSASAEAYRALRTSLSFLSVDKALGVLQFTSAVQGEGKSTTAANLAFVMSRAGQRVVLLDCDLRRPRLHDFFGLPNTIGFTDLLVGNASLDDVLQRVAGEENLSIITSGPIPPDPSELLSSKKARDVIEQIRGRADLVIIDSPPVLAVTDPLVLANVVDAVVLVAAAGKSDKRFTIKAMEQLQLVDAHVVGAVLNRQGSRGSDSYGYGYGYGYRSEYKSSAPSTQPASPAPSRLPIPTSASQPDAVAELDEAIARVQLPSAPTVAAGETDPTPPEIS